MNWGRWNVISGVFTSFSNLHHVHGHQAERCPSWRSVMPTWRHEGLHYLPHPSLRACVQRSQWQNADAPRGLDCGPLSRLSWGGAAHFFSAWPPNTYRPPKLAQVVYCPTLLWTAIHFSASLPWVTVGIAFRRNEFSATLTRSCWTRDSPSWKPYITGLFALSSSSPSDCSLVCHLFRT